MVVLVFLLQVLEVVHLVEESPGLEDYPGLQMRLTFRHWHRPEQARLELPVLAKRTAQLGRSPERLGCRQGKPLSLWTIKDRNHVLRLVVSPTGLRYQCDRYTGKQIMSVKKYTLDEL